MNIMLKRRFNLFYKNISDVKDLYEAAKHPFEIEKFLNIENAQKKLQIEREKTQAALKERDPEIITKLEKL